MNIKIDIKQDIDELCKRAIRELWNREYPALIQLAAPQDLDNYLAKLRPLHHLFLVGDNGILGWLFIFEREDETWFAMILDRNVQGKGYGAQLLSKAGTLTATLNGWAIDEGGYTRADGSSYSSPLDFYRKMGFEVLPERMDTPFSAVKVRWKRKE